MKVVKWLFISICVFTGLLILDGGSGVLMRTLFHDGPRYYELTTKLEVNGEPVEVTRVIECEPYFTHRLTDLFQKRWYAGQEAMTHRLPDGSGLIVVAPRLCEAFARPQPKNPPSWKAFPKLPEDFVPLIFWTPDVDNPEVLEGYHSFESVARPGSRIHLKEIFLRNSPDLEPGDYPEEFGVWVNAGPGGPARGDRPRQTFNYKGYYLLSLEREAWETVPELSTGLEAMTASGFLKPELKHLITGLSTNDVGYGAKGVVRARRSNEPKPKWMETANFQVDALHELRGFDRTEERLTPNTKYNGIITYFRRERLKEPSLTVWVRPENYVVKLNGNDIVWPNNSDKYYYDVKSEVIFHVRFSYITLHAKQRE